LPSTHPRKIVLDGTSIQIAQILSISRDFASVSIADEAIARVQDGRTIVDRIVKSGKTAYGLNTGFGVLAERKIDSKDLDALQLNLIRSHATGVGSPLSTDEVRAVMAVRLNTLLKGYSGVRPEIVYQLRDFLNSRVTPEIPRYGSLGASGDLAPSAHLALTLIGEGNVIHDGKKIPTRRFLKTVRLKQIRLKEKEGLAIINGTQVMSALGCLLVTDATNFLDLLDIVAALSLEALGGNIDSFDPRIHELRPIPGQIEVALRIRQLVSGSDLLGRAKRVQDPYSLRCIPQVHGGFREALKFAKSMIEIEINSVTDNPVIFSDDSVISAGNFHGQPIAMALDLLGSTLAEACVFSERRTDKLLSGLNPLLPMFLTKNSGLRSGMMILQYTAAALINQNIILGAPAGLHSAVVSAGQEDHASMGVTSALKAREIIINATKVVAIELICGCQAVEILGQGRLGKGSQVALKKVRKLTKHLVEDRSLSADIEQLSEYLQKGEFASSVLNAVRDS